MRTWTPLASIATLVLMAATVGAQTGATSTVAQPRTTAAQPAGLEQVQETLRQKGHDPGPADGVMGPQTIAALKAFQKEHGLEPSGQLDRPTLAKLGIRGTASDRVPPPGSDVTPRPGPNQTQAGGDTPPSPADPAQAHKTGGNAGEGASYSRSNEKPTPDPQPK
jgi:peptidoglycan hydrolase-like protein with peptidoglycan-binding domain